MTTLAPPRATGGLLVGRRTRTRYSRPGDYLEQVAPLMFPSAWRRGLIVMLRVYLDAGETQKGHRVFYAAGFLATVRGWIQFNKRWRRFLRDNHLPYFHMSQYVARQGPYRDWSDDKRRAVIERAIDIIATHAIFCSAAAFDLDDYDSLDESSRRRASPYGIAVTACIAKTARALHDRGIPGEVAYVFELGDASQGQVRIALEEIFARPDDRQKYSLLSLSFEDKRKSLGLQAADILAWEMGRLVRMTGADPDAPLRKSLAAILDRVPNYGARLSRADLERILTPKPASVQPS